MKVRGLVIVVFVLVLVGAVAPVRRTEAGDKTAFTGTETFDPFGLFGGGPVGGILSPGIVQCPGFEPTGNPLQPCPPGSRTHVRGLVIVSRVVSSDPRLTGSNTVVVNANFDEDFTGQVFGTYSLAADNGGTLNGTWEAMRVQENGYWVAPLHCTGHGTGALDGLQALFVERAVSYTPMPIAYIGTLEGRFIEHQ